MNVSAQPKDKADALSLWEPHIRSFVSCCPASAETPAGPLQGLSVGVKDIIDVAGLPTRNGSMTCAKAAPASKDAVVVAALRAAGAHIAGKTVTTEFAFTDPTDCRNPYGTNRSPGGSSSGSGAAVAAGLVDIALGTQTAGSLCRPAAYCGVVGFKPGYGILSTVGVTPLAPHFDSVGVIARSVDLARAAFVAMIQWESAPQERQMKVARWLLPGDVQAAPAALDALNSATEALSRCTEIVAPAAVPCDTNAIIAAHRTVMLAEAAQAHGHLLRDGQAELLRPRFRAALVAGHALDPAEIAGARQTLTQAADAFWTAFDGIDAILTLPVPDGAPKLDGSTGLQDWLTPWTVFGGPLISLPWGLDALGRPRAVMLAGKPGSDLRLIALAQKLEACAPPLPPPVPPAG